MPVDSAGRVYGLNASPGISTSSMLTMSNQGADYGVIGQESDSGDYATTTVNNASATLPPANYWAYLLAIFGVLVMLKFASEHEKSGLDPKIAGIGVYNFVVVGIMSSVFIISTKVILTKYPVKGLSNLAGVL